MPSLSGVDASDDEWYEYAEQCGDELIPHLENFILGRFSYKPRYVKQRLSRSGKTISAFTRQYDLYLRLFIRPEDFWPRECLVLARIMFSHQRAGHGSALVKRLLELAPEFGYRYLAIESANANASAFARRLGFTSYENGRHWVGSIEAIQNSLLKEHT